MAESLRVLVIGSGGREHALVLALTRDPQVRYTPGGTAVALPSRLTSFSAPCAKVCGPSRSTTACAAPVSRISCCA